MADPPIPYALRRCDRHASRKRHCTVAADSSSPASSDPALLSAGRVDWDPLTSQGRLASIVAREEACSHQPRQHAFDAVLEHGVGAWASCRRCSATRLAQPRLRLGRQSFRGQRGRISHFRQPPNPPALATPFPQHHHRQTPLDTLLLSPSNPQLNSSNPHTIDFAYLQLSPKVVEWLVHIDLFLFCWLMVFVVVCLPRLDLEALLDYAEPIAALAEIACSASLWLPRPVEGVNDRNARVVRSILGCGSRMCLVSPGFLALLADGKGCALQCRKLRCLHHASLLSLFSSDLELSPPNPRKSASVGAGSGAQVEGLGLVRAWQTSVTVGLAAAGLAASSWLRGGMGLGILNG
ncbi:uncharacterized protein BDZ99DRAFT_470881 [Mytilinidion resinicola]|uniref:Uncharacterized protein n=1 Tax=Mytilinidion resinicola TaxID=574789 RepID=A0A6A6ZAT4_9PEZI|nr:uncharacterized protein BDZ99DRAFT_470881 [Mytilinidion resinicola]KAF2817948.1 hypothetical protein BDZ99DRAFT_470881 [Mytilinidion resinicola]